MDTFPDSLLLEIFDYLNYEDLCLGVRVTCTRWWRLTQDGSLWKNVQIGDHFTDQRFILLLEQPFVHTNVENLECSKCENLTAEAFDRLADLSTPKLKKLCVPLISAFPPSIYAKLANSCPQLEELENVGAKPEENIHPLLIQHLFPRLKAIHDKPLASYGRIRCGTPARESERRYQWMNDLSEIAFKNPNIESYYCRRGLQYVNDDGLEKISVLFPKLTELELAYCSITDKGLALFFENNQTGLTKLIMDKPGEITDGGLRIIADFCPNIQNLKLSRCVGITNEGVVYLVRKCHSLTELHLNNKVYTIEEDYVKSCDFSDDCVKVIASECPRMVFLRLFYSSALTAAGIGGVGLGCSLLEGLMLYECPQVDDACLSEIAAMPNLRALVMVGCDNVTPAAIVDTILTTPKLLRFTMFSNLSTPTFYGDMSDLAETTYAKICADDASYRPNVLRKLTLKGVGGPFLQLLTVLCPDLHTLDLREGCIVNNVALNSVIRNCENLSVLDIQNVSSVSDSVIDTICEHAVRLRKLGLGRAVHKLSNTALVKLISSCRSLKSVAMDTKDSDVDEELLVDIARSHHGGSCFLHVDYECRQPDNYLEENHRLVELHFTPIKYLSSIHSWAAN